MRLNSFLQNREGYREQNAIQDAVTPHRRGEVRGDGPTLTSASRRLEIEWPPRDIRPWDRCTGLKERKVLFAEQSIADTDAALTRLFNELPELDVIEFRAIHPDFGRRIFAGAVKRFVRRSSPRLFARTRLWQRGVAMTIIAIIAFVLSSGARYARSQTAATASSEVENPSTSTDLFVMIGSDFDRPGLVPRANYNIGIGHTFGFLKKDPIGDELTFGYTYENAGTHGFLDTAHGEHTESAGVMKNLSLPKTKAVTGYTWLQSGITSYTGNARVQNRLDSGVSLGVIVHFNNNNSIWIQESYSKVVTVPWYTTTSIGYTYSW